MTSKTRNIVIAAVCVGVGAYVIFSGSTSEDEKSSTQTAGSGTELNIPAFSAKAKAGEKLFQANCADCHGLNATGSDQGPPLIHDIYNPGHHADMSFYRAVSIGTRQHHWRFGNMAPLEHIKQSDVTLMIKYIRELQVANGISYKKHTM